MKRLLTCLLAPALILAFAACKGEPASGARPTEGTTIEETTIEETEGTTAEDITSMEAVPAEAAEFAAVPADTAGIVRYYNEALGKTPMRRTSYKRTMTKITGFAKALGITILDEPDLQDNPDVMPYVYFEDREIRPADLVVLEMGWVKDASASVQGGDATLTIAMRDHGLSPDLDPKPGTKGYVSTLDRAAVVPLVCEVAMALAASVISPNALKEVTVTDSAFGLGGGKYTVVIDTDTGEIKSLTFTGTQQVEGNARCVLNIPLIPAAAKAFVTLRGNLEAVYAPSAQ